MSCGSFGRSVDNRHAFPKKIDCDCCLKHTGFITSVCGGRGRMEGARRACSARRKPPGGGLRRGVGSFRACEIARAAAGWTNAGGSAMPGGTARRATRGGHPGRREPDRHRRVRRRKPAAARDARGTARRPTGEHTRAHWAARTCRSSCDGTCGRPRLQGACSRSGPLLPWPRDNVVSPPAPWRLHAARGRHPALHPRQRPGHAHARHAGAPTHGPAGHGRGLHVWPRRVWPSACRHHRPGCLVICSVDVERDAVQPHLLQGKAPARSVLPGFVVHGV